MKLRAARSAASASPDSSSALELEPGSQEDPRRSQRQVQQLSLSSSADPLQEPLLPQTNVFSIHTLSPDASQSIAIAGLLVIDFEVDDPSHTRAFVRPAMITLA